MFTFSVQDKDGNVLWEGDTEFETAQELMSLYQILYPDKVLSVFAVFHVGSN